MLEIDGVLDAWANRPLLDEASRKYVELLDLYTKPGERTEHELAKMQRRVDKLFEPDMVYIAKVAIEQWDKTCDMRGQLWPAYVSALFQMDRLVLVDAIAEDLVV